MVLTIFEGGTTQSTSQSLSVPVYIKKESTNPGRKIECTCALMMGKTPDVQFGMLFSTLNVRSILGKWVQISVTLKRFVFCR